MNTGDFLRDFCITVGIDPAPLRLGRAELEPETIAAVMINEVPPQDPDDDFYSPEPGAEYPASALSLLAEAGVAAGSMAELLQMGVYVTNAVKTPKSGYAVEPGVIAAHLPILKAELALFPKLKVIALMGDVAKKAVNLLHKAETGKNLIPSEATYKIRGREFYRGAARVLPSYIMTGGNILIEKSKRAMIADDMRRMMELIK